jgi:hypothetical protein
VQGVIATNDCGRASHGVSWDHELRRHYGAALQALALDNCTDFLEERCLANVREPPSAFFKTFTII